jgi:predicted nuclease with TOPRIM domain
MEDAMGFPFNFQPARGGWSMFGPSQRDVQSAWMAQQLTDIREGINKVQVDLAGLSQNIKSVRDEQTRHEQWLQRLEGDVQRTSNIAGKLEDLDTRVANTETKVSDLHTWKTAESAKWTGSQRLVAFMASMVPLTVLLWSVIRWALTH